MEYPNPCDTCTAQKCNYRTCASYVKYVNTAWKKFRCYRLINGMNTRKFVYEHPDIIRRYLKKGPCDRCQRNDVCDVPCPAYWRWWDARMEWFRVILRGGKE